MNRMNQSFEKEGGRNTYTVQPVPKENSPNLQLLKEGLYHFQSNVNQAFEFTYAQ